MGRRASVLTLVIINIIVTLVVVFVVISVINSQNSNQPANQVVITVPVLITATKDPNVTESVVRLPFGSSVESAGGAVSFITETPQSGTRSVVALPTGLLDGLNSEAAGTVAAAPTIDPALIESSVSLQGTATALPENCILHTVAEGDTPFAIAEEYGADGFELLAVNGIDENGMRDGVYLQIGDVLIVPLEGCSLTALALTATEEPAVPTDTPAPTGTPPTSTLPPTSSPTASRTPTATLPATAANAQVEIVRVVGAGDINAEGVDIRNNGAVVDVTGWELSDGAGSTYTFPQQRLFQGGVLTVYTRVGTDTPNAKFWGRDTALWASGATLTLSDGDGRVQSTYRVP